MAESTASIGRSGSEIEAASVSRLEHLIDIPFSEKMIDSLIALFNYFDIYAPRMELLYSIITYLRFFQLIGGSFMAANLDSFADNTLAQKVMSVITVLFHIVPLEYRRGNEMIILGVVNGILLIMGIYLQVTAFSYKSTSKVPRASLLILSVYLAIGPFLLVPISSQYTGQLLSAYIQGTYHVKAAGIVMVAASFIIMSLYIWIIKSAYSISLVWRPCSFQSIEGTPQTKLLITTTVMTLVSSLTTYFTMVPSAAMIFISILFYVYSATTCFKCGTYINRKHTLMVLAGSIIGILLCIANLIIIFLKTPWNDYFFAGFAIVGTLTFVCTEIFLRSRSRKELSLLDQVEDTQDITILKSKNNFKQILATGFQFAHPICLDLSIFKLAANEWKDALDMWSLFAKFCAIYPENSQTLQMIRASVASIKSKDKLVGIIIECTNYIIKTRETKYTPQLKTKISKLSKLFMKTRNRQRNIWDLVLQGNISDLSSIIKRTQESVNECEIEMSHLLMQYPSNRFVAKQNMIFLNDVKGDPIEAKKYSDVLSKLQRGFTTSEDNIHSLGMIAFPNLPEISNTEQQVQKIKTTDDGLITDDIVIEETVNIEAIESISKQIDNHKIPAIQFIYFSTLLLWFFFIVFPFIMFLIAYKFFAKQLSQPVTFMEGIAQTRNIISMLSGYVNRYLYMQIDDPNMPGTKVGEALQLVEGMTLAHLGGSTKSGDVLKFIASKVPEANTRVAQLRSFQPKNSHMDEVRNLLFESNVEFNSYLTNKEWKTSYASIPQISYMISNHVGKLLSLETITAETACNSDSLITRNNVMAPTYVIEKAMHLMLDFIKMNDANYLKIFNIVRIILIIICAIVYPIVLVAQIKKLRQNRFEILQMLTILPKTVISSISQSFSKLKDGNSSTTNENNTDQERNRQEESIIKLFNSISDGSSKASIETSNMFCFMLIVILGCVSYYLSIDVFIKSSANLMYNSNHINYVFGSNSFMFTVVGTLLKIALAKYHPIFENSIVNITEDIVNLNNNLPTLVNNFQMIRLGSPDPREVPFPQMEKEIVRASNELVCHGIITPPKSVIESCHCFSVAQQFLISTSIVKKYSSNMQTVPIIYPNASEMALSQLWQIGPIELYETFFGPAGDLIVPIILEGISKQGDYLEIYAAVFIVLTFIISIIVIISTKKENEHLKFCLKLFLRCPPNSILNNKRIMDLLGGNYNFINEDLTDKHNSFSNEIVNKLNEIVIVCQEETNKIISVNLAFEDLFKIKQEEIENTQIKDFFVDSRFEGDVSQVFTQKTNLVYTNDNKEKVYLEFNTTVVSGRRIFSGHNNTSIILHEKMIADEKKKSDAMLASILPPMLVPRVQSGEKNISFSVQSATVLFLDVVEFTPWCGSHDAAYVMRMLNIMFKEFDAITNAHKTMTKIKCIGDCYMAAGGIFDEVNQPAIHSKEVVDFGCCVIHKLIEIDERENENLRIRVGVNTGGPIVAGIIGTEKPTFEILGPAINIAHEMEHHGVPMKVHISRPVYELIYGQQFDIKERGEIDVKGNKMFTYIVEP